VPLHQLVSSSSIKDAYYDPQHALLSPPSASQATAPWPGVTAPWPGASSGQPYATPGGTLPPPPLSPLSKWNFKGFKRNYIHFAKAQALVLGFGLGASSMMFGMSLLIM
jgi:hypothetical protein